VNVEFGSMWKEAYVNYLELIFQGFLPERKKTARNLRNDRLEN
jgi:hypothetical protein